MLCLIRLGQITMEKKTSFFATSRKVNQWLQSSANMIFTVEIYRPIGLFSIFSQSPIPCI